MYIFPVRKAMVFCQIAGDSSSTLHGNPADNPLNSLRKVDSRVLLSTARQETFAVNAEFVRMSLKSKRKKIWRRIVACSQFVYRTGSKAPLPPDFNGGDLATLRPETNGSLGNRQPLRNLAYL